MWYELKPLILVVIGFFALILGNDLADLFAFVLILVGGIIFGMRHINRKDRLVRKASRSKN